jgi:hypothetical protein
MSIQQLTAHINALDRQRQKILLSFKLNDPLIIGSITQTKGRCGKPNCECARKPSHPITLLMTTVNGKKRTQLIRKNDIERIMTLWMDYKNLVAHLKVLKELHQKEIALLRQIIHERSVEY